MKHSLKAEMKQSMDALHFTQEEKTAMVRNLTLQMKQTQPRRHGGRKLMAVALAAAMVLVTLTGAAVFTRWSTTAQIQYNPSQEVKEQAEKSGLSVMLEETKGAENSNEVLSVTDQGITITAVQTIVDNYHAEIIFRIEGFDLPEDENPHVWPVVSIDGDQYFGGSQSGWFYNGLTTNEEGKTVYVDTGEPVQSRDDEFHSWIMDWVLDDGSLEYTHYISFEETDGRYMSKEIVCNFYNVGFQSHEKAGMPVPQVEGNWELRWTLTGNSDNMTVTPNVRIGDSDVILLEAEIGQKNIRVRYQLKDYWKGWDELAEFPQIIKGVRMKDGSEYRCGAGSHGFEDQENMIYYAQFDIHDAILDISQVESLMFHKGWENDENGKPTVQTFWYIPIA